MLNWEVEGQFLLPAKISFTLWPKGSCWMKEELITISKATGKWGKQRLLTSMTKRLEEYMVRSPPPHTHKHGMLKPLMATPTLKRLRNIHHSANTGLCQCLASGRPLARPERWLSHLTADRQITDTYGTQASCISLLLWFPPCTWIHRQESSWSFDAVSSFPFHSWHCIHPTPPILSPGNC